MTSAGSAKLTRALAILDEALTHQLANRATPSEFYSCYTYSFGHLPDWVKKAKRLLGERQGRLMRKERP